MSAERYPVVDGWGKQGATVDTEKSEHAIQRKICFKGNEPPRETGSPLLPLGPTVAM
jgi:hypothetical protein